MSVSFYHLALKAKKSYGQHFLTSEHIAQRIVESLEGIDGYNRVLEVGPGKGVLTRFLLDGAYDLRAVEADEDMVVYLQNQFPGLNGKLIHADFLRLRLDEVMEGAAFGLIGNFPYNISSQILIKMVEYRHLIPEMVGMFQKEMAERVIAPPGGKDYGVISILVQAYYEGKYLFTVKQGSFNPPPKVLSGVIRLTRKNQQSLGCDEQLFRRIVKQAFNQRRKMLRNTLKGFFPEEVLREAYFQQRPEVLSVEDFIQLTRRAEQTIEPS